MAVRIPESRPVLNTPNTSGRITRVGSFGPAPKKAPTNNGGGGGGGNYDYGPIGGYTDFGPIAPTVDYKSLNDEKLGGYDSTFKSQLAALNAALQGRKDELNANRSRYDVDMSEALRQLGISGQTFDDPTTKDVDESTAGEWLWRDMNTLAGRSRYNLMNDYASRGVLQSSMFGDARTNLDRSLTDQVNNIGSSRASFLEDMARQQAAAEEENKNAILNARNEAIYRLVSGITI